MSYEIARGGSDAPRQSIPPAEYCPVSIGARLIGDRWTLLVIRELLVGASGFNDILRGLPGISRTLLAGRLRHLEHLQLVTRRPTPEGSGRKDYVLTESGAALWPLIEAIGRWAVEWKLPPPEESDVDLSLLLWRISQGIDTASLPRPDMCVEFRFLDADPARGYIRISGRGARRSACIGAPEHEADVVITANPRTLLALWFGQIPYAEAASRGLIRFEGPPALVRQAPSWFRLSPFAERTD
ncbi:transcriptional regulator [Pseudonocardia sp. C8]|uniref:winged helix-turn-helix transcriptional regulator n=1 Tax=Pseudonocardia sp. C8 TaxID=2762759 RepID=UPI00164314E4|nr:helix-turn-helix domain-containing protein [Pseudonocardia sp. C8]MBC3194887.1 transcriptional regulator [Pseudonocardia sp. C8]